MIRVVRRPELIGELLRYVGVIGDATGGEFWSFLVRGGQKIYWNDYRNFSINMGFLQEAYRDGRYYYVPTRMGRHFGVAPLDSHYMLSLVPQYRRYCEEIFGMLNEDIEDIDLSRVHNGLDLVSNDFASPSFREKDQDHNFNRYRLWDKALRIRTKGQGNTYYRARVKDLLSPSLTNQIRLSVAYITGDFHNLPNNQIPLFTLLLLLMIADHSGVALDTRQTRRHLGKVGHDSSLIALKAIIEHLDRLGIPINLDKGHLSLNNSVILSSSENHFKEVTRILHAEEQESTSWKILSRDLSVSLFDSGLFGESRERKGSEWVVNPDVELGRTGVLDRSQSTFRLDSEGIKHDGSFDSYPSKWIANIFDLLRILKGIRMDDVVKSALNMVSSSNDVLPEYLEYPSEHLIVKSCLFSPLFLGPIPLLRNGITSLDLTPLAESLLLKRGDEYYRRLATILYYTNPHVLLASELIRHENIDVVKVDGSWRIVWKRKTFGLIDSIDAILSGLKFRVLNDQYVDDEERKHSIEDILVHSVLNVGIGEVMAGGRVERSNWFHHLSQSKEGEMFYNSLEFRRLLPQHLHKVDPL